jgi:hypothetical protein
MALINCPECQKEVSDKAQACIHCGYTLIGESTNKNTQIVELNDTSSDSKEIKPKVIQTNEQTNSIIGFLVNRKKIILTILIGIIICTIIGITVYFSFLRSTIIFQETQLSKLLQSNPTYGKSISDRQGTTEIKEIITYNVNYSFKSMFDNQLFPVVIFALSNSNNKHIIESKNNDHFIGNSLNGLGCSLSVSVSSSKIRRIHIRLEIEGADFIKKSIIEADVNSGEVYTLFPKINYNYALLERNIQPSLENIGFKIYCENELKGEFFETIQFRGINEVPFLLFNDEGEAVDLSWLFAAFVNEDNPDIDQILKEALNIGIFDFSTGIKKSNAAFGGYQFDGNEVINQVFAIWNVFQRRGIKYSNITTTSSASQKIVSQYVRTFSDILKSNQANCVEGSILFASIMRKIGIDPFLIILPGHMLVGFWKDYQHSDWEAVETTILGKENLDGYIDDKTFLIGGLAWLFGTSKNEISRKEFNIALKIGGNSIIENIEYFNDEDNYKYKIIDIANSRQEGIRNISK